MLPIAIDDHCSRAGAERLAHRLAIYWHSRGFRAAELRLVDDGAVIAVRGNLVNGLPPASATPAKRPVRKPPPAIADAGDDRELARAPAWLSNLTSSLARLS